MELFNFDYLKNSFGGIWFFQQLTNSIFDKPLF